MNAIKATIDYIQDHTDARVTHDTPTNRNTTDDIVSVHRAGGPRDRFLDEPRLLIDCISDTAANAYVLAEHVYRILRDFPDDNTYVSDVSFSSIYRNEWSDGRPCYTLSCSITINTDD